MSPTSYQTAPPRICMLPQAVGEDSLSSASQLVNNCGTKHMHSPGATCQISCSVSASTLPKMIRSSSDTPWKMNGHPLPEFMALYEDCRWSTGLQNGRIDFVRSEKQLVEKKVEITSTTNISISCATSDQHQIWRWECENPCIQA